MNRAILKNNITSEKQMLIRCKNNLKGLPKGSLSCYKKGKHLYFKKYDKNKQVYVGGEDERIVSLLKKRHMLEIMISTLETNIELMEKLYAGYKEFDPAILERRFTRAYQNIPQDLIRELGYSVKTKRQSFYEDQKIYKTSAGIDVRSRIEALIAEIYTKKGISFDYEAAIKLPDGSLLHPDFTVYCPSCNKHKYHEHIGLLSDPDYMKSYLWKLERYIANDLYPYYDVLFTYEKPDHGIDMNEIEYLIDAFMK
ncbi:MAG: hypothetical protein IJ137_10015 [Eubacterium sp.]|nr:hypothetical protein [Eubacterium sp.]